MPRPRKMRRVFSLPRQAEFLPADGIDAFVTMTVDEYEVIRLIDFEGYSQEECGRRMQIARTTVQLIYDAARKKLAQMLVSGLGLRIEGGDYELSPADSVQGGTFMKIAVTYENGQIFQHFGHTEQFKLYTVEGRTLVSSEVIDTNGSGHSALATLLANNGVEALICGGIGAGAQMALAQAGVLLFAGITGSADDAVAALLDGTLAYNANATCSHHDHGDGHSCGHHHHGEGHTCGSHGCGGHDHHCGHHDHHE